MRRNIMKGPRARNHLIKLLLTLSTCAGLAATQTCTTDSLQLGCILVRQVYRMTYIIQFILALSFVSGWGFIIAAIFKFKQVRENPQQVPVSTPFAFLLTAMLLIFMPGLMRFGGETLFVNTEHKGRVAINGDELSTLNFLLNSVTVPRDTMTLGGDSTVFGMARRTTDMFPTLTDVIINCAYIAGLGFAIAGLFKMKSVRDNPQQNTIAGPISYLIVSVLLIYMPDIIAPTSQTLFGTQSKAQLEGGGAGQNFTTLIDISSI